MKKKVIRHLEGDIKDYEGEIAQDKKLIKDLKGEKMKKQGYNSRLDESLGVRHRGAKKQSLKDRRDESKAMEKKEHKRAYSGDERMDMVRHHMKEAMKHFRHMEKKK